MNTFEDEVSKIANEITLLVIQKRKDYGKKNILNSIVEPETVIAVRLHDKIARLANLVRSGAEPQNESLIDTANDIIGYGIVLRMVLDDTFETKLDPMDVPF